MEAVATFCKGLSYTPIPLKGYWVQRSNLGDFESDVDLKLAIDFQLVTKCPWSTCKGFMRNNELSHCWKLEHINQTNTKCEQELIHIQCETGAIGPLCASCRRSFVYSDASSTCIKCAEAQRAAIGYACGLVAFVLVIFFFTTRAGRAGIVFSRLFDRAALQIIFITLQIVVSVVGMMAGITFPSLFSKFTAAFSFMNLNFGVLTCLKSNPSRLIDVYVWSISPIILIVLNGIVYIIRFTIERYRNLLDLLTDFDAALVREHTTYFLALLYLVLPPVTSKQLGALDCIHVGGGRYLRSDTSVDCNSEAYNRFVLVDVFFIVAYLSVPLGWICILYRNRSKINPICADPEYALFTRNRDESLQPFTLLFSAYKPRYYLWETVEM